MGNIPRAGLKGDNMITIKRLKELIKDLPDEATCHVYEGERIGIAINHGNNEELFNNWWIDATDSDKEDIYTEGFGNK